MKRQSLYIGGALLATTALSTSVQAGTIVDLTVNADNKLILTTVLTTKMLNAQVFGAENANAVVLGDSATFAINFTNSLTTTFDVDLESTNSDFSGGFAIGVFQQSVADGLTFNRLEQGSFMGCTVQVLTERVLIEDCISSATDSIDAFSVSGVNFDEANGLATAGSSIVLSGIVRGSSSNNTFELISNGTLVTSSLPITTTITAGTAATISNTASPPFSDLVTTANGTATTLSLATVVITQNAIVGISLSTPVTGAAALAATAEFTITHGVLTDAATTNLQLATGATGEVVINSAVPSAFNGNVASFDITTNTLETFDVSVNFDGTTAISAWAAGTLDIAFSPGTSSLTAVPAVSGAMAALTRGGFTTQLNTLQSSEGNGATLFQSFVRVVNNGTVSGTATLTVRDDSDGSLYGSFTTATIEPNATVQVGMPAIEAGLGITGAGQYQIGITGSYSGYAQHVMFNSVNNTFIDLSGFRSVNP